MYRRISIGLFVLCLAFAGCISAEKVRASDLTKLALSTPEYFEDFKALKGALSAGGIRCFEGDVDLGTSSLLVRSGDFEHVKHDAQAIIAKDGLTVRLRDCARSWVYEVWQKGKKVREESYATER